MNHRKTLLLIAIILAPTLVCLPSALLTQCYGCHEGCTPGYWKQPHHLDSWTPTGYAPSDLVGGVFDASGYPDLASKTLLQALSFKGGPGLEGGARILLRAGVAALLNAAHPDVDHETPANVIAIVDAALASGDRDAMLSVASALDEKNNLGCPLNSMAKPTTAKPTTQPSTWAMIKSLLK